VNPAVVVGFGAIVVGLLVTAAVAYMAGKADGAEEVKRAMQTNPREEITRTQCATCLLDVAKCRCLWRRLRGEA
jgi:uncharacterized membrane protein YdjX (TVP38/TMEM64 family)